MIIIAQPSRVDVGATPAARAEHRVVVARPMCAPPIRRSAAASSAYGLPNPATAGRSPPGNRSIA
jgi:hypothetical protein